MLCYDPANINGTCLFYMNLLLIKCYLPIQNKTRCWCNTKAKKKENFKAKFTTVLKLVICVFERLMRLLRKMWVSLNPYLFDSLYSLLTLLINMFFQSLFGTAKHLRTYCYYRANLFFDQAPYINLQQAHIFWLLNLRLDIVKRDITALQLQTLLMLL